MITVSDEAARSSPGCAPDPLCAKPADPRHQTQTGTHTASPAVQQERFWITMVSSSAPRPVYIPLSSRQNTSPRFSSSSIAHHHLEQPSGATGNPKQRTPPLAHLCFHSPVERFEARSLVRRMCFTPRPCPWRAGTLLPLTQEIAESSPQVLIQS